tara:strand:- start:207 stop:629 length:423 start_codon:yes stop_codon:yes gene_type:complete
LNAKIAKGSKRGEFGLGRAALRRCAASTGTVARRGLKRCSSLRPAGRWYAVFGVTEGCPFELSLVCAFQVGTRPLRLALHRRDACATGGREKSGTGFALGFGVGRGFGFVFEDVVGADEGEGLCLGLDEVGAGGVDAAHA